MLAIGDDELPIAVPPVSLGNTPVVALALGALHSCVLHNNETVRCWGHNSDGRLGYGHTNDIGDNELPSSVGTISIGGAVDQLFTGYANTCVRIGSDLKCWGDGSWGMNGYSSTSHLGDNELPSSYGMIDLGMDVTSVNTNLSRHTCAMNGTQLRCWGRNAEGQLGYGNMNIVGDDEVPAAAGSVPYF
jgi:alpha-tubulin suppressor-like RCC1 family protein